MKMGSATRLRFAESCAPVADLPASASDAATDESEEPPEPPDDLVCPITYSLFRDPVRCLSDGRVYERSGIVGFWQRRPLADFLGGPRLEAARLEPALDERARVRQWLDDHPEVTPPGWPERDPGRQCDQALCDELSAQVDRAAAARAAAEAAEVGGGAALGAALDALQDFARSVRLVGHTPGGRRREFLGVYDRCEHLPLVAGRALPPLVDAKAPSLSSQLDVADRRKRIARLPEAVGAASFG